MTRTEYLRAEAERSRRRRDEAREARRLPVTSSMDLLREHSWLTVRQADLICNRVPKRGTDAWDERETLRRAIGNRCISLGSVT